MESKEIERIEAGDYYIHYDYTKYEVYDFEVKFWAASQPGDKTYLLSNTL